MTNVPGDEPVYTPRHRPSTLPEPAADTMADTLLVPLAPLLHRWQSARWRLYLASQRSARVDPADLLTELRTSTRIAQTVTEGRWWRVAALLRTRTVYTWAQIAEALNMPAADALEQFAVWIAEQASQYDQTGQGLTPAEVADLAALIEAVTR